MKIRFLTLSAIDSSVSELPWNSQNLKELCSFSLIFGQSGFCRFAGGWGQQVEEASSLKVFAVLKYTAQYGY